MPEATPGPTLTTDADPTKCHGCGAAIGGDAQPHRAGNRGYSYFLCPTCEAAAKVPPPVKPHAEAQLFGPLLNRVMMLREHVADLLPENIASALAELCYENRAKLAVIPALAHISNPARLLDVFIPNPPSGEWQTRCRERLIALAARPNGGLLADPEQP